ncbi:MAG TPA: tetratricopeptide repeat protein [Isosphaeraceae bacterium]|nr:tetratricopeptide repeat protein [Isosphaeraceae bacterium]
MRVASDFDPDRRMRAQRRRVRSILLGSWLGVAAILASGCTLLPRQPAPPGNPVPPNAAGPVPVPQAPVTDPSNTFQKTATDRQKFQVHLDFGKVFESQGEFDRAAQEYQDALAVAESKGRRTFKAVDRALAHRRLAAALDRLGRFPQAEEHYRKAIKLSPKDARIWNDAGYSHYLQGRWADAERDLKTASKLAPADPRIRTNLGLTLAAAGRSQEALALLSSGEGDAVGHANLGYILAGAGQHDLARQHYQKALALRPDLDLARRALAQIDRQQQGLPPSPPTQMAQRSQSTTGPVDPRVTPASTSNPDDVILPPPPPLPMPTLPSRTLP